MLLSVHDEPGGSNAALVNLALRVGRRALDLRETGSWLHSREVPDWVYNWPGEHYVFLAALVEELRPEVIIEIGTGTGLSSLAMLSHLPTTARLVTYDLTPWEQYPGSFLRKEDFADGRFTQRTVDLGNPKVWEDERKIIEPGALMFVDGPKDAVWENRLLALMNGAAWFKPTLLVFDDIRLWNMLATWRAITQPKLDLTSLGHFTGTGLVDWSRKLST